MPTTTATTATATTPTATTTPITTTTLPIEPLQPAECLTATNFTESWRMEHNGSNYEAGGANSLNGYACDLHQDTVWFRFTGAAGNRMLNSCPEPKSCGTYAPLWTDGIMPTTVGVKTNINAYAVGSSGCKVETWPLEVLKCSNDTSYDLIYRVLNPYNRLCKGAFCGMN